MLVQCKAGDQMDGIFGDVILLQQSLLAAYSRCDSHSRGFQNVENVP